MFQRLNQKLRLLWRNKKQILQGYFRLLFKSIKTEEVAEERLKICRTNKCGKYDPTGSSPNAFVPGAESCGACGCALKAKVRCMECECGLVELNLEPLWRKEIK